MTAAASLVESRPPAVVEICAHIADAAATLDTLESHATDHLAALGEAGLLDLGVSELLDSGRAPDLRAQAETIALLAEECMSTAFTVWAHRMVVDYLARGTRSSRADELLADLRTGRRAGCTAMASGLKALAGIGDLTVDATRTAEGWILNGSIDWASNLTGDAIVVLPARTDEGTVVFWLDVDTAGFAPRHISGLLALDSTDSGRVTITDVTVSDEQVLSTDLPGFAQGFRPTFLVLQSSFCAGLIRRSLAEATEAIERGDNAILRPQLDELAADVADFIQRWASYATDPSSASRRELLQLRLDGSHLATRATRLEATLAGGRGYLVKSAANRRFREAAFLPVQSPSEGHLLWELSSLDSTESTPVTDASESSTR